MEKFDFAEWKKEANKILEPYQYRVTYIPDHFPMPYEHIDVCNRLEEWLRKKSKKGGGVKVTLSADEVNAVRVALIIYGDVLMDVHRGKIKKELKMVIAKAILEAETEDSEK